MSPTTRTSAGKGAKGKMRPLTEDQSILHTSVQECAFHPTTLVFMNSPRGTGHLFKHRQRSDSQAGSQRGVNWCIFRWGDRFTAQMSTGAQHKTRCWKQPKWPTIGYRGNKCHRSHAVGNCLITWGEAVPKALSYAL